MSLRVWLPLNGDLHNQGLDEISVTNSGAVVDNFGKIGKCYSFDGSAYMYTASSPNVSGKSATFWVYATNTGNFVAFCDYKSGLAFGVFNSYIPVSCTVPSGVTVSTICYPKSVLTLNAWNHIALVRNETTPSLIELWVNGEKQTPNSTSDRWTSGVTDKLSLGARPNGNNKLNGKLNDFRIYDHALSPKEIKEISKALVIHYSLDGIGANENLIRELASGGRTSIVNKYNEISLDFSQNKDIYFHFSPNKDLIAGENYTISCECEGFPSDDNWAQFGVISQNSGKNFRIKNGYNSFTFTVDTTITAGTKTILDDNNRASSGLTIVRMFNVKLEKGSKATPWIPAPSDPLYTKMGFDSTIVYDESGFGNDGTIINDLTYDSESPRYNLSTCIATTSSHIVTPALTVAGFTSTYTFSWWQKRAAKDAIMAWGFQNGNRLNLYQYVNNLYWNTGDGTSNPFGIAGSLIMDNTWHHVVITGDGTTTKLYIDGEFKANAKIYRPITGTIIYISGWATGTGYSFNPGCLSDFRIYATALSPEDIKELYEVGMSIDNKQNIHTYEIDEAGAIGISKTGILTSKTEFIEEADDPNVHLYKSGEVTANHFYEE